MNTKTESNVLLPVKIITVTAMLTAMNIVLSSFGIPMPGGHLYLNDVVICTAAILLNPFSAFVVGGIGAFLGDFFFYPTPMFVSLVTHGLQAVVISLIAYRKHSAPKLSRSIIGVAVGAVSSILLIFPLKLGKIYRKIIGS